MGRTLRLAAGFVWVTGWRFVRVAGLAGITFFAAGLRLRLVEGDGGLAIAGRRRGERLTPEAADWVFLTGDARFMD